MSKVLKKKRVSMKNKAAWRKHTDIKDVEDFLEDQRLEERIGKASDKTDDDLFAVDTTSTTRSKSLSNRAKRKLTAAKAPKCFTILTNTSKVQDPVGQRDKIHQKKNGRNLFDEILDPKPTKRIIKATEDRLSYLAKRKQLKHAKPKNFGKDLWAEKTVLDKHPEFRNDWISKPLVEYHLRNIGKPVVKVHASLHQKTSKVKAFEPPHPGMSYNPTFSDHQALLQLAVEKEAKIIKEEKHLKRVTTQMFRKVTEDERENNRLVELSAGLETSNEVVDENDSDAYVPINPAVEVKKKSRKQRRKKKEQRDIELAKLKKKEEKKKITDIHRLKQVETDVIIAEEELTKIKKQKKIKKELRKSEPRRVARLKYSEPEVAVNMGPDIAGNLRNLKTESDILIDRFQSLQKRNILPPTKQVGPRRKAKVKRFVNSTHKEIQKPLERKKGKYSN